MSSVDRRSLTRDPTTPEIPMNAPDHLAVTLASDADRAAATLAAAAVPSGATAVTFSSSGR